VIVVGTVRSSTAFVRSVRLTSTRAVKLTFLFSDLCRSDGVLAIQRGRVSIAGPEELPANAPTDYEVTVADVIEPGNYSGKLEIRGDGGMVPVPVPILVVARSEPSVEPLDGTTPVGLKLVRCDNAFDCALAHFVLPESAFGRSRSVLLVNTTDADAYVASASVALQAQTNDNELTTAELQPDIPVLVPAYDIAAVSIMIDRSRIPPDHYTGAFYIRLKDAPARIAIPADVSIREGPSIALMLLLLGVLIGLLYRFMQGPGRKLLNAYRLISRAAAAISNDAPYAFERRRWLSDLRTRVPMQPTEVAAGIALIDSRVGHLTEVDGVFDKLYTIPKSTSQSQEVGQIQNLLFDVRQSILADKQEKLWRAKLEDAQRRTATALKVHESDHPDVEMSQTEVYPSPVAQSGEPNSFGDSVGQGDSVSWAQKVVGFARRMMALPHLLSAARFLLYVVTVVGLVAVGMLTLYIQGGTAFGANPFGDYLGVLLWGIGADVAGRSLANLTGQSTSSVSDSNSQEALVSR
jgi:hypothetical protein